MVWLLSLFGIDIKMVSHYLCYFPETHAGFFFFFFLSFHEDALQSHSIQVPNKMCQMHGEKPSHSILSGYLKDIYKLTFDHFGWEDQCWLWKWPQLSFSIQKLSECLNAWIKTLTQSDSTWVAALSEVRDWKTGWIWGKLAIYFCLWFTTLSQHIFFFFLSHLLPSYR